MKQIMVAHSDGGVSPFLLSMGRIPCTGEWLGCYHGVVARITAVVHMPSFPTMRMYDYDDLYSDLELSEVEAIVFVANQITLEEFNEV